MKAIIVSTLAIFSGVLFFGMATSLSAQETKKPAPGAGKEEGGEGLGEIDINDPFPNENPYLSGKEEFLKVEVDVDLIELPLEDLIAYIADQIGERLGRCPSFVFKDDSGKIEVPTIVTKGVTVDNVFVLLERLIAVEFDVIDTNPTDDAEGFVLIQKKGDPEKNVAIRRAISGQGMIRTELVPASDQQFTRAYSVARLLNFGVTPEELNEAFEARWSMNDLDGEMEPMAKFHDASSTIIVRGTMQRLEEAEEMIQLLLEKEEADEQGRDPFSVPSRRKEEPQSREGNPSRMLYPKDPVDKLTRPGASEAHRPSNNRQEPARGGADIPEQPRGAQESQGSGVPREPKEPGQSSR